MPPIRLGVIGLGLIWVRVHKPILATMTDVFTPVAFCDSSEQRRQAVADEFAGACVVANADDLLSRDEVEAVLVLTPLAINAPMALAAIRAGKHVLMEKPIARGSSEGRALLDAAARAGKRLFVLEQAAYRTAEDELLKLLGANEIGHVVMWDRVQHVELDTAEGALRYDSTPWRKAAEFPLGTLFDGGIHIIASLSKVFGRPATVAATGRRLRPDYGDYDHTHMQFRYADGITGTLSHSTVLPAVQNHYHVHGTTGVISVEMSRLLVHKPGHADRVIELPAENAYLRMWQALAAAWASNWPPAYTAEDALRDVQILEAVEQAIKQDGRIAVAG